MENFIDLGIEPMPPSSNLNNKESNSNRIGINRNYLPTTILQGVIMIFEFALWISCASVAKPLSDGYYLDQKSSSIRSAFLFFAIVGFILSSVLFIFILFNFVNFKFLSKLPWIFIILLIDVIMLLPILILSIFSAVNESDIKKVDGNQAYLNYGAFAAASFFGFVCCLMYVADIVIQIIKIVREGLKAKILSI